MEIKMTIISGEANTVNVVKDFVSPKDAINYLGTINKVEKAEPKVATPKKDGSGKGIRANKGRGECVKPLKVGKGKK